MVVGKLKWELAMTPLQKRMVALKSSLDASLVICNGRWQSGIDRHLIDIHLFGEYNFSIPRDGVGIMTKPLRGDAISNP